MTLPWPPRAAHPNARNHWSKKANATRRYKTECLLLNSAEVRAKFRGKSAFNITFHPPDKRRRDLDGMLSSFKAGFDALSMIAGVDDVHFRYTLAVGDPIKGGAVIVEVTG